MKRFVLIYHFFMTITREIIRFGHIFHKTWKQFVSATRNYHQLHLKKKADAPFRNISF